MNENLKLKTRPTRKINVGTAQIGGDAPITVQSMCATRTTDLEATLSQLKLLMLSWHV